MTALDKARAEGAAEERARGWSNEVGLQTALAEIGRLTEVLRDIAGNGDPDFPSYSQAVARSALGDHLTNTGDET